MALAIASVMAIAYAYESPEDDTTIFVRADPNGLAFDRNADALYVADAKSAAVIRVAAGRQTRIASLPPNTIMGSNHLAGLAVTPYGTIYAARLGYGRTGAVLQIEPDGECVALANLPPQLWRLGVAYDGARHVVYSTQFHKSASGPCDGAVVEIDLASGHASTLIDGFLKPVGIAVLGSALVVSDARMRTVFRIDLEGGRAVSRAVMSADLGRVDALCAADHQSVLVTSYDDSARRGVVHRVWLDGRHELIAAGDWQPRGVATDGQRAFISARRSGRVLVFPL